MREKDILHLIRLLQDHEDLVEIELTQFPIMGSRLRVSRRASHALPVQAPPAAASNSRASADVAAESQSQGAADSFHPIKAPMVGTFYAAPSPGAEPFVSEGARVSPGGVLCIIEAMKLMNEIECDISGTVREICIENGQAVEFGQVLFLIELD